MPHRSLRLTAIRRSYLDSSDDFTIYKNGKLHTAHQVKAKISKNRSGYSKALEQSTLIEHDKIKGTTCYFHVSVPLNNTDDHRGTSGEIVKFYRYGDNYYCGLGEVEELTKELIIKICNKQDIIVSDNIINFNFCLLSEKIDTKAIHNHKLNQVGGISENRAAYEGRSGHNGRMISVEHSGDIMQGITLLISVPNNCFLLWRVVNPSSSFHDNLPLD